MAEIPRDAVGVCDSLATGSTADAFNALLAYAKLEQEWQEHSDTTKEMEWFADTHGIKVRDSKSMVEVVDLWLAARRREAMGKAGLA